MKIKYLLAASVVSLSAATAFTAPVQAQQTTSGFSGTVADADGNALTGATVTITDTRTGQTRTLTTGANGAFNTSALPTGGPYTVTATADGYEGQSIEGISLDLSAQATLTFNLTASDSGNVIIVSGNRVQLSRLAIGPSSAYDISILESVPTINRDIRDVIRIDPRVSLAREAGGTVDRITCLGANDRSNTFTVDGIVQADVFGLNGTPFAARNTLPLPFDSIKETAVEFAPFDVQYGQFTGCAINVVTKSGSNTFGGSAFFEYQGDSLTGDRAGGEDADPGSFDNYRWGATLDGPIIKDKLFFHVGYEETDFSGTPTNIGPTGAGFPREQDFITIEQFNEIRDVIENQYGIEVGEPGRNNPETSRRFFGRLDWYITPDHRLELTYQNLEESLQLSDSLGNNVATGIGSFRIEGTDSDYYSARLFSQWTDNFSTEVRYSRSEVTDIQDPLQGEATSGNPIPQIRVGVVSETDPSDIGFFEAGPGQFRSANDLFTTIDQARLQAEYVAGNHTITIGGEMNHADYFNLFIINATGIFTFANVDNLRAGILNNGASFNTFAIGDEEIINNESDGFIIANTTTGEPSGAAAEFSRTIWSAYVQDEWQVTDQLNVLAGVRVDIYDGDSAPNFNPLFTQRYGFSNTFTFGQLDPVVLPRLGITYDFDNFDGFIRDTQIRGGVGIFTGGDPSVWFSNAYSNDGFASAFGRLSDQQCIDEFGTGPVNVLPGGNFTGVLQCALDAGQAAAQEGANVVQSIDPNLELPTVTRVNLGLTTRFGGEGNGFFDDWSVNLDYIYTRQNNPFNWVDLTYAIDTRRGLDGFTVDGRPLYSSIDPLIDGCTAQYVGSGTTGGFTNVNDVCFGTRREDEIQLTNSDGFDNHVASIFFQKSMNQGLFTDGGRMFFSLGYAFTESNNRRDTSSSTATSNFTRTAAFDRQDPAVSASNFQVSHNITIGANFEETFFDDLATGLGIFFNAQSGTPYSITFDGNPGFDEISSSRDAGLLYIPTGLNDPNVVYTDLIDRDTGDVLQTAADAAAGLDSFINANSCISDFRGQTIARNTCRNDWFIDLDLRLSQQLPGPGRFFGHDDRIEVFAVFDNFLNFLDSTWNARRLRTTDGRLDLVDGSVDDQGRYEIRGFNIDVDNDVDVLPSRWRIQVGARYEF